MDGERVTPHQPKGDSDNTTVHASSDVSNPTALPVHEVAAGKSATNKPKTAVCRVRTNEVRSWGGFRVADRVIGL